MKEATLLAKSSQQLWTDYTKIDLTTGGDADLASPHFFREVVKK